MGEQTPRDVVSAAICLVAECATGQPFARANIASQAGHERRCCTRLDSGDAPACGRGGGDWDGKRRAASPRSQRGPSVFAGRGISSGARGLSEEPPDRELPRNLFPKRQRASANR